MTLWLLGALIAATPGLNEAYVLGTYCGYDVVHINGSGPITLSCDCKFSEDRVGYYFPCVNSIKETAEDNVVSILVGYCYFRCLVDRNTTTYIVDLQRDKYLARELNYTLRPACVPLQVRATEKLSVSSTCQLYCHGREPRDVDDGSLCVRRWKPSLTGQQKVLLTGACWEGICKAVSMEPWKDHEGCLEKNVNDNGMMIASSCLSYCDHGIIKERKDGTPCVFSKEKNAFGKVKVAKVGECRRGVCMYPGTNFMQSGVSNGGCHSSSEFYINAQTVAKSCKMKCPDGSTQNRKDETNCILDFSKDVFTTQVNEVGVCSNGTCVQKCLTPPKPDDPTDTGCNVKYVEVKSEEFVAEKCMASCRHQRKFKLPNGTPCLYYFLREYSYFRKSKKTFAIGQCQDGHCTRGRFIRDIIFY